MQKKIVSMTLAVLMLLSLSVSALAVTPRWITTDTVITKVTFSGTTATCTAYVGGSTGTNKIAAKTVLEKKNSNGTYSTVKTWEETVYSDEYALDGSCGGCTRGATYRLTVTATVSNSNGKSETVSGYSTGTC